MPGAVAIGGAELSCETAAPFTYMCHLPYLICHHERAFRRATARNYPYTRNSAQPLGPRQLTNPLSKTAVVLTRLAAKTAHVRVSQRLQPRLQPVLLETERPMAFVLAIVDQLRLIPDTAILSPPMLRMPCSFLSSISILAPELGADAPRYNAPLPSTHLTLYGHGPPTSSIHAPQPAHQTKPSGAPAHTGYPHTSTHQLQNPATNPVPIIPEQPSKSNTATNYR